MTTQTEPAVLFLCNVEPAPASRSSEVELFTCTIDGAPHLVWSTESGENFLVPAACPHKPTGGPILTERAVVGSRLLLCLRHNNSYDLETGTCIAAGGPGDPGVLHVRRGMRQDDTFVVEADVTDQEARRP
jgi:nitrite reductase/ring-hydroxylating ferredoxin subunit